MKNLFKFVCVLAMLIGSFSFANLKTTNRLDERNPSPNFAMQNLLTSNQNSLFPFVLKYGCKTFHVKVSIKLLEIETDVTICAGCTHYIAMVCGGSISKNSQEDLSFGGMDLNALMKDKRFADAEEITILESSSEAYDDIKLTATRGTYKIVKDENGYGTIVNLEQVK